MDIGSGQGYPSSHLSNFHPYIFEFDGVKCYSMEGLLQSFKFKNIEMQQEVCKMVGKQAKFKGKKKKWWKTQTLYWAGVEYKRDSKEYQELLDKAFEALSKNASFKKTLLATGDAVLTHNIGKIKQSETVLTRQECCSRLMKIRDRLRSEEDAI